MSKKRQRVLYATFLAAAFAVVGGFAVQSHVQLLDYQRRLEAGYTHAFTELTTASEELTAALKKASYTTPGPLQQSLYQQVYAKALTAQYALGQVPTSGNQLEQTAAFFAKTGDYVSALARDGGEDASQTLAQLTQTSQALTAALEDAQNALEGGALDLSALSVAADAVDRAVGDAGASPGGTAFQTIEADFPEMPALIYDGPFSEHLSSQTPKALEGLPQVTWQEALTAAARFLRRDDGAFTLVSAGEGVLPTFGFSLPMDGGLGYIEVTQQGGQVISFFRDCPPAQAVISPQDGVALAGRFLADWGLEGMEPSYYLERDGALTVHFAPVVDGVYCYPDLIKVTVALDDGALLGYEAHGYLAQHTQRTFEVPAVSQDVAMAALPEGLHVLASQLALIPTGGGTGEVLTYEFKCQAQDGSHVLVYVNAQTGQQQNILLLLEDETGTLTL